MRDYQQWRDYLAKAKNGHDRPIDGSRTKRVITGPGDSIRLRLHNTDVVTVHPDGTYTVWMDGWNTVTTRRFINDYTPAHVWTEKGEAYVRVEHPNVTEPKVRKCRRCTDGYQPAKCFGPTWCYPHWFAGAQQCEHGSDVAHKHDVCEHGRIESHPLPPVECWQCKGSGRYDYGSKVVHYKWGSGHQPLLINAEGYAVQLAAAPFGPDPLHKYSPQTGGWYTAAQVKQVASFVTAAGDTYGDSRARLESVLPALETYAALCPEATCDRNVGPVEMRLELADIIIHLNDGHAWTREQIADWLDTLDADLTFPVPETIPAHVS